MNEIQAKATLCRLLSCNIDLFNLVDLKVLVRKRKLAWHPDKNLDKDNPNQFTEQFIELTDAWKVYLKSIQATSSSQGSFSSDEFNFRSYTRQRSDLFCDESMSESEDEMDSGRGTRERTPEYNDSPFDDDFFIPSPKKKFAVPEDMRAYFRSASNRRAGKFFALFTPEGCLSEALKLHKRFATICSYFGIYEVRTNKDLLCILLLLNSDYRLADIKKECRKFKLSGLEAFYCTKFAKCVEFCKEKYGPPKEEPTKYSGHASTPDGSKKMNYKMLSDFALANEISDPYELMYEYSHLSTGCDRSPHKITNEHESDHTEHLENAKIFEHMSDKKRVAKNAVDSVFAKLLIQSRRETNLSYLNRRCKEIGNDLQDNFDSDQVGEAWYYCTEIVKNFKEVSIPILNAFIYGVPRERYVVLKGDFKCGKTSFANGFNKLFEGTNINVNVDRGRLPFYLGQAIGRRFVLFDDVKGRAFGSDNLSFGNGFSNLDDLRDHIDGHVEVQLEKKNQQPISQIFPAGIITCNDYYIPPSLKERIVGPFEFRASPKWRFHGPTIVTKEIIFIGLVLYNLLPVEPHIFQFLYTKKAAWEEKHIMQRCPCKDPRGKVSYIFIF